FLGGRGDHGGADHGQARHQGEADHQGGAGRAGAARVAQRVAFRHAADGAEDPQQDRAEHPDHASGEERADGDEADQRQHHAESQPQRALGGLVGGARQVEEERAAAGQDRADDAAHPAGPGVGGGARVAQGGHRGDPAGPAGGQVGGEDGDDDTEEQADRGGGPGDGEVLGGQFHADGAHQLHQPDRQPDARAHAQQRADDAEEERLRQDRAVDLLAGGSDGPHQADLPGALGDQHGEGVDDQEDADEEGDAGEAEHGVLHDAHEALDVLLVLLRGLGGGLHLVAGAELGPHVLLELLVGDAVGGGDLDVGVDAALADQGLLGGLRVEEEDRGAGVGDGEVGDAGDLGAVGADGAHHPDLVTQLQAVLVGGVGVHHDLVRTLGRLAGGDLHG